MTRETEEGKKQRKQVISDAVLKEYQDLPKEIRNQFLFAQEQISWGLTPELKVAPLGVVGKGVLELKINGRPAYRLVYTLEFKGEVIVLAARRKTCNGPDKKLIEVAASRLKSYRAQKLRKER